MLLKDLKNGQNFKIYRGGDKIYKKINDHKDNLEYNTCICVDSLRYEQKTGIMLTSCANNVKINKNVKILICNRELKMEDCSLYICSGCPLYYTCYPKEIP